jgi:hypothetical protein
MFPFPLGCRRSYSSYKNYWWHNRVRIYKFSSSLDSSFDSRNRAFAFAPLVDPMWNEFEDYQRRRISKNARGNIFLVGFSNHIRCVLVAQRTSGCRKLSDDYSLCVFDCCFNGWCYETSNNELEGSGSGLIWDATPAFLLEMKTKETCQISRSRIEPGTSWIRNSRATCWTGTCGIEIVDVKAFRSVAALLKRVSTQAAYSVWTTPCCIWWLGEGKYIPVTEIELTIQRCSCCLWRALCCLYLNENTHSTSWTVNLYLLAQ